MSAQNPEISIIIPVYNINSYIGKCVESIENQSFTDYEVIIVDDGSTDGSGNKCDQYKINKKYLIKHTQNAGPAHARNIGLENARGKYIAFIDGDDAISADYLEVLYNEIEQKKVEIVACCCKSLEAGEEDLFFEKDSLFSSGNKKQIIYQLIEMRHGQPGPFYYTGIGVPWGKLYRRDFIEKHNLRFDIELRRLQDNMFNMYAFHYATAIRYINKPLYLYRRGHVASLSVKYNKNLAQNSISLLKARSIAMKELGYDTDDYAVKLFNGEAYKYYREILKNIAQYYPNDRERYHMFSTVFHCREEYELFYKHINLVVPASNWTVFGRKMELWMVRHDMCSLLYTYLRMKKYLKRVD